MAKSKKVTLDKVGLKYLKFAKLSCLLMVIVFMAYVGFMMFTTKLSYASLITENPILLAGFINCGANLLLYLSLTKDITGLINGDELLKAQIKLAMDALLFLALFNLPGLITVSIGCYKSFSWNNNNLNQLKTCLAKNKLYFSLYALLFIVLILWCYWIALSFR